MNPVQLTQHKPLTNFEQLRNVKSVDLTIYLMNFYAALPIKEARVRKSPSEI